LKSLIADSIYGEINLWKKDLLVVIKKERKVQL
jgi:hypothetical protein